MVNRLTLEQKREVRRLRRQGVPLAQVAREVGCGLQAVSYHARWEKPPDVARWSRKGGLALLDREEIFLGLANGLTYTEIAGRLGCAISTVSREVNRNGGRDDYRASTAHAKAFVQARRPKRAQLATPRLKNVVTGHLERWYSPQQIAARLRIEFPDDPMMWVSHETIYKSIYVQGRGELKRELIRCLRYRHTERKLRGAAKTTQGHIKGMVNISERPKEVADRAVAGHWEGDLIIGAHNASGVGTLVERTTGYLILLHLPEGKTAEQVSLAMKTQVTKLPETLMKSITWDQGAEMSKHAAFTVDTGIQVYFCDPHSPWQRPSNENTNGLLRQYLPKGTDLTKYSQADLDVIADSLNDRPRRRLGFMKPSEKFAELLALTG